MPFFCAILPTVCVKGGLLYTGIFSLIFEGIIIKWVNFYKKNIFKNIMQKNLQIIILHVLRLFKKDIKAKQKDEKNTRLCLSGVQLISLRMMFKY